MSHPRVYNALKSFGHSPQKALEILLDAKRGDRYALNWIRFVRSAA
jgi:hypothetical protein